MNIYLVERVGRVWYDETAGMVIIAKTEKEAIKYFLDEVNKYEFKYREKQLTENELSIRHIGVTTEDCVYDVTYSILTDFRAG
jgi:phage-related protein